MQVNNSQPSFGMAYKKPNLKGFAAASIDAITAAYPESVKLAQDVDIKISMGTKKEIAPMIIEPGFGQLGGTFTYPCFDISFSRPANSIFAKIVKATGLFTKYDEILHKSKYFTSDTPIAQQKKILIEAIENGKARYRKLQNIDIEEAKAHLKEVIQPKKRKSPFDDFPDEKDLGVIQHRKGKSPLDDFPDEKDLGINK